MKSICGVMVVVGMAAGFLAAQQGPVASHATTPGLAQPSAAAAAPFDPERPVARVNGVTITGRDLREQMQSLFPYYSMHGGKIPEKYQAEIRQKAVEQLIDDELLFQEAKRRGQKVAPATLQKVLREARQRFQSRVEYEAWAKSQYGSVADFERRVRRAVLIAQFQHNEFEVKARVSEAQIRNTYDKNKTSFLRPESVWMQTISVLLPDKPSPEQRDLVRKRGEEILPQAKATKSFQEFGVLAEKVSEDDYRVNLGDRKWVHVVGLPPGLDKAVARLQPGQVSDLVELPNGYVIVRINERRAQKQMEYSEMREQLRRQLEQAAQQKRVQALQQQLHKRARIEML